MDLHTADMEYIARGEVPAFLDRCRSLGRTSLDEKAGKTLLAAFGLSVPRLAAAADPDAAALACERLTPPYVVKVLSSKPLHKSELGGVRLGLRNAQEVRAAALAIRNEWPVDQALIDGFLVEEMAAAGHELVVGGYIDPQFGPVLMVGLGGVFVEIFADVTFRVCPIDHHDARAMLRELRAFPVLQGARGRTAAAEEAIVDALVKVGGRSGLLMSLADQISELDINPLIVSDTAAIAVDARIVMSVLAGPSIQPRSPRVSSTREPVDFMRLFEPRTIAVAGVSTTGQGVGNRFIENLDVLGFSGEIYPMHPSATSIGGRTVYRRFAEMPRRVDYAYIAVPRAGIPDLLKEADGKVTFAQIMTSGFGEGGRGAVSKHDLTEAIKAGRMRVLGPNCLGIYSPLGRVSFAKTELRDAVGHVAVISQSGGFGVDMIRSGQLRGLRFSAVVTIGNSIDLGANDLLEHFLADESTRVIGLYLEDIDDGRRFFDLLIAAQARKPVVLLKGGRTSQGQKAAASHTGSLAGDNQVWQAVARQTGCILVDTLEELIDSMLLFQTVTPEFNRPTQSIALLGNGGGASVVATDGLAQLGFSLAEFSPTTKERLQLLNLPDGASDNNPIDVPGNVFDRSEGAVAGDILAALSRDTETDAIVVHANLAALLAYQGRRTVERIIDACIQYRQSGPDDTALLLVLRSDGSPESDAAARIQTARASAAGVPVFQNIAMASRALRALASFEKFHFMKQDRAAVD
jgi:acyl-CoA synthetase (NDP forming)